MKNRHLIGILTTAAMILMPFLASSQVKQVFKVVDYDTKQPIAGATTTVYGQKITTDAKGVAVATLPADKKDAYLSMEEWLKEGYMPIGRQPESFGKQYQTKDTIKFYMADKQAYRKDARAMFDNLYRFVYDTVVRPTAQYYKDSIAANPDQSYPIAQEWLRSTWSIDPLVKPCISDAYSIGRYGCYEYDAPKYAEVLQVMRSGDVNKAVSMAKEHVDLADNSRGNLEWVDFYRWTRSLDFSTMDDALLSDYSVLIYRNRFLPLSYINYIEDLNRDQLYDKADSIIRIEKAGNKDPRFDVMMIPNYFRYVFVDKDNAKLKALAEQTLETALKSYRDYPCRPMLGDVYWNYKNLYFAYATLGDSVSATRTIDSAMAYMQKYLDLYFTEDEYSRNQRIISMYQNLLGVLNFNLAYIPATTVNQLYSKVYDAAKANYDSDTSNLMLKLQLAENAVEWLKNVDSEADDTVSAKYAEILEVMMNLEPELSKVLPEYYAVQNIQIASQYLGDKIAKGVDNEQMMDAFRKYEQSFDVVNALYPKAFVGVYQRLNAAVEGYMGGTQQSVLSDVLTTFNDRLISISNDNDPQKILVAKAEYANGIAESLYQEESYDEAIGYYLQADEWYKKAIPNDEKLWIPYLANYLQMGDAHFYQNQFDKAVMTYQKILDYESQIPASMMPQYTTMKGSVNYYVGDVYKSTGDYKRAEKEYKAAEKWYKKAIAMGDSTAYHSMGEMYWGKAVMAAQQEDMKKCKQMLEISVANYEKCAMNRPLTRYERAKSTLGSFYEQGDEKAKYYANLVKLVDFYRNYVDANEDYAVGLVQGAEELMNSGTVTNDEALQYAQDIVTGVVVLSEAGRDVELAYLRSLFNLARMYVINDSVESAIGLYRDCASVSEQMYADTAMQTHNGNMAEIYLKLALCYEQMAEEIDTAHSEMWYYRAIDVRDSLIDLMKELNEDGDINLTYKTAIQYRNNGALFYELDMVPSAQDYIDKSNDLLMMLYNSEFKADVEDDVIQNYFLKGVIYYESNNDEEALKALRKAVEFGERVEEGNLSPYYLASAAQLLEILEKDKDANAAEIAKLTKAVKAMSKKLK